MIKFKQGTITNPKTGITKNIMVAGKPNNVKEIVVGCGMVIAGITYLTINAFKHGSKAYEMAEVNTLKSLGLLTEAIDDGFDKIDANIHK